MRDLSQLRELIAGLGRSGVRNVIVADTDHAYTDDYEAFTDSSIVDAMRIGGFTNAVIENPVSANAPGVQSIANFREHGVDLYFPDARFNAYQATVNRVAPNLVGMYATNPNIILGLAQTQRDREVSLASLRLTFPDLNDTQIREMQALIPALWQDISGHDINARTTRNIRTHFPDSDGGRIIFYGAAHVLGRETSPGADDFEMTGDADLDTAFPGLTIAILRTRGEVDPRNGQLRRDGAINWSDPPDIIYYTDETGDAQFEDLRSSEEQRLHPLRDPSRPDASILTIGATALANPGASAPDNQIDVDDDDEEDDDDDNDTEENGEHQDIPWGQVIGAAIGGWLTSTIGDGFGRIFAMLIGGLIGWVIGGSIGGNHGQEDQHEASAAASTVVTPDAQTLAFANVTSVNGSLHPTQADPGELLDSPPNFLIPTIDGGARSQPL